MIQKFKSKMMAKIKQLTFKLFFIGLLVFTSCSDDDNVTIPVGSEGFFIVNEGSFGGGNTSLSFYDRKAKKIFNDVFSMANGRPLGDQAQSMTIHNGNGYIVVQNSDKIEVIDIDTYKSTGTISENLPSPRYFLGYSETKGYVSDWGDDGITGTVKVLDLTTNKVTKTIPTGQGANQIILLNDKLYVTNSGGRGRDSTISVINTSMDEVERTITVSDNPNSIIADKDGNIWIGTTGYTAFSPTYEIIESESTPPAIIKIDPNGNKLLTLIYKEVGYSKKVTHLNFNTTGDKLYYLYSGSIYVISPTATELPAKAFTSKSYYGLSVDPNDGTIIGFEAPNFSSSGEVDFYDEKGGKLDSFVVGIGPNGAIFK